MSTRDSPDPPHSSGEPPPERVRSTPGPRGPVPVRDLMKQMAPETAAETEGEGPRLERTFQSDGEEWVVRTAGSGAYGTGRLGTARLVAVHFYRHDDPEVPLREALLPAGAFQHMHPDELRDLLRRATPIELDR